MQATKVLGSEVNWVATPNNIFVPSNMNNLYVNIDRMKKYSLNAEYIQEFNTSIMGDLCYNPLTNTILGFNSILDNSPYYNAKIVEININSFATIKTIYSFPVSSYSNPFYKGCCIEYANGYIYVLYTQTNTKDGNSNLKINKYSASDYSYINTYNINTTIDKNTPLILPDSAGTTVKSIAFLYDTWFIGYRNGNPQASSMTTKIIQLSNTIEDSEWKIENSISVPNNSFGWLINRVALPNSQEELYTMDVPNDRLIKIVSSSFKIKGENIQEENRFPPDNDFIYYNKEIIKINETQLINEGSYNTARNIKTTSDYTIDMENGYIQFNRPLDKDSKVTMSYDYKYTVPYFWVNKGDSLWGTSQKVAESNMYLLRQEPDGKILFKDRPEKYPFEKHYPNSTTEIETNYDIHSILGIWTDGLKSGENYYTTYIPTFSGKTITFSTPVLTTDVYYFIEYTRKQYANYLLRWDRDLTPKIDFSISYPKVTKSVVEGEYRNPADIPTYTTETYVVEPNESENVDGTLTKINADFSQVKKIEPTGVYDFNSDEEQFIVDKEMEIYSDYGVGKKSSLEINFDEPYITGTTSYLVGYAVTPDHYHIKVDGSYDYGTSYATLSEAIEANNDNIYDIVGHLSGVTEPQELVYETGLVNARDFATMSEGEQYSKISFSQSFTKRPVISLNNNLGWKIATVSPPIISSKFFWIKQMNDNFGNVIWEAKLSEDNPDNKKIKGENNPVTLDKEIFVQITPQDADGNPLLKEQVEILDVKISNKGVDIFAKNYTDKIQYLKVETIGYPLKNIKKILAVYDEEIDNNQIIEYNNKEFNEQEYKLTNKFISNLEACKRLAKKIFDNHRKQDITTRVDIIGSPFIRVENIVAIYNPQMNLDRHLFEVISITTSYKRDNYITTLELRALLDKEGNILQDLTINI